MSRIGKNPVEIPGVSIANFLRTALQARLGEDEELDLFEFQDQLMEQMQLLEMDPSFAERPVNVSLTDAQFPPSGRSSTKARSSVAKETLLKLNQWKKLGKRTALSVYQSRLTMESV